MNCSGIEFDIARALNYSGSCTGVTLVVRGVGMMGLELGKETDFEADTDFDMGTDMLQLPS